MFNEAYIFLIGLGLGILLGCIYTHYYCKLKFEAFIKGLRGEPLKEVKR